MRPHSVLLHLTFHGEILVFGKALPAGPHRSIDLHCAENTMRDHRTSGGEVIHKDVVIIGNGPSGISLSMMLAGNLPYLISRDHPDEMLSARLQSATAQSLAHQPLDNLATGLEGRSTNPISLLLDALEHPCADLGIEISSLVQWQYHADNEIDHVVIGKGPPGGSWHTMDPNVLTLSLGSWMALPGLPYSNSDCADSQRRASAGSVAQYYETYVKEMNLTKYFTNGLIIRRVEPINRSTVDTRVVYTPDSNAKVEIVESHPRKKDCDLENPRRKCSIITAINFIRSRTKCNNNNKKSSSKENCVSRSCKRPRDVVSKHDMSPNRKVRELIESSKDFNDFIQEQSVYNISRVSSDDGTEPLENVTSSKKFVSKSKTFYYNSRANDERCKLRSFSFSCDNSDDTNNCCEKQNSGTRRQNNSSSSIEQMEILCECEEDDSSKDKPSEDKWLVHAYNIAADKTVTYTCRDLVLATGASDLPNRLGLSAETYNLPWVLHDLRALELNLDSFSVVGVSQPDPVLVVGAGLSAADAVIATNFRSIPVLHVFRNRSVSLDKQLPENMYPEYHKVHQMMLDGGSTYPQYTALPEHTVTDISTDRVVTLTSKSGTETHHRVSYVVILIGSRPDLHFLPSDFSLGINRSLAVDSKSNPIDIDKMTHSVYGYDGLYALGPLAGDNFVRFIPGGALAIVSDLYKKKNW